MEEYKLIVDFPNYEVSNHGNVRNKTTGKILQGRTRGKGYFAVALWNEKKKGKIFRFIELLPKLLLKIRKINL
jgi:hypothetical protein